MKDLETRFYASHQGKRQEPKHFFLRFIKIEKRLELQVQDYVEVRNPENTVQLLDVLVKFEERYPCKAIRGLGNSDNVEGRGWNERSMSSVGNIRGNLRNSEVLCRPSNGRNI
ncbi:UNVERIFIED_CONTAM: hypothetical protein NCL1_41778 [Trichonephila clavipes]